MILYPNPFLGKLYAWGMYKYWNNVAAFLKFIDSSTPPDFWQEVKIQFPSKDWEWYFSRGTDSNIGTHYSDTPEAVWIFQRLQQAVERDEFTRKLDDTFRTNKVVSPESTLPIALILTGQGIDTPDGTWQLVTQNFGKNVRVIRMDNTWFNSLYFTAIPNVGWPQLKVIKSFNYP